MLDEAQSQEVESIDIKSSNNLKNDFVEQAKMASDQIISMTSTSNTKKPYGEDRVSDEECESGYCYYSPATRIQSRSDTGKWCRDEAACFSSETLVTHSELDLFLSQKLRWETISRVTLTVLSQESMLSQEKPLQGYRFYQLHSKTGIPLEVTDCHMVFLKNKVLPIAAKDVRVGDVLKSDKPEDDTEVTKNEIIRREGYYNPFTESGTLILNDGIVASSYD